MCHDWGAGMNSRTKAIIEILCENDDYITLSQIGKEIGVSSRTVLRELDGLEQWLKKNELTLDRKPKAGIRMDAAPAFKMQLVKQLSDTSVQKIYSPKERQDLILLELTQKTEPIKQYYFSSIFEVSEATISHDLDKIDERVEKLNVTIVRKPGIGIYMEGREKDKRHLIVQLLYEYMDKEELYGMMHREIAGDEGDLGISAQTQVRLLNIIGPEILNQLEKMIGEAAKDFDQPLADSAKIGLIVHLALVIKRIKNHESIEMAPVLLQELAVSNEYKTAKALAARMEDSFGVSIPDGETGYIAMHLKGSRMTDQSTYISDYEFNNFQVVKLANQVIRSATEILGTDLNHDKQLLSGLVSHLKTVLIRLKLDLGIRNPLLEDIKERYHVYFKLAEMASASIEDFVKKPIPDAEIGFIAMHLGSAIERLKQKPAVYRAIVTCTNGIGSSQMLATRLVQEFKHIEVVEVLSTIDIEKARIEQEGIDLVISTVDSVDINCPVAVVSPILTEKDIKQINKTLDAIEPGQHEINRQRSMKPSLSGRQSLDVIAKANRMKDYASAILELLTHMHVIIEPAANSYETCVDTYIGQAFKRQQQNAVRKDLFKREEIGATILKEKGIMLMHCKSKAAHHIDIGIVRPKATINAHGEDISLILFLVAPLDAMPPQLDVLSETSKELIRNRHLGDVLIKGNQREIEMAVEEIYDRYIGHL